MDEFVISPEIPCVNQETKLLTTVTTPNLGEYFGYEIEQNGNFFNIKACYAQGFSTALQTYNEVVDFGILPAGNYEYEYIAFLSEVFDTEQCLSTAFTQNEVVGNFTVLTCNDPNEIQANFEVEPISCFGENDGSISIAATGGIPPYQYSINGNNYQNDAIFSDLNPGTYTIHISDANGIVASFPDLVIQEALFMVDCGMDIFYEPNEVYNIIPTVSTNSAIQSAEWTPTIGLECPTCLVTGIQPPGDLDICYTLTVINEEGCSASDEICFVTPNNVLDINAFSFQIFPNPTSQFLNIALSSELPNDYQIQLINIKSQSVFSQEFNSNHKNHQINVSDLPNGIYLIQIASKSLIYSRKFVKN